MKLMDIINELDLTLHSNDRMNERIFSTKLTAYFRFKNDASHTNHKIGTYNLQPNVIGEIQKNIDFVNNPELKLDPDIVFAIIMHRFSTADTIKGIDFDPNVDRNEVINSIRTKTARLILGDEKTKTFGVSLIWIIKANKVITAMLSDTLTKESLYNKLHYGRHKFDNLVAVGEPEELEYYYSDEDNDFTSIK